MMRAMWRRFLRIVPYLTLGTVGLAVLAAGGLVIWGRDLAKGAVEQALAGRGLDLDVGEIVHIGLDRAEARDVSLLDGALRVGSLELRYAIGDLTRGAVDRVAISGLRAEARIDSDGILTVGALSPADLIAGSGGGGVATTADIAPFQSLSVTDAALRLDVGIADMPTHLELVLADLEIDQVQGGGQSVVFDGILKGGEAGSLALSGSGEVSAGGRITADLEVSGGSWAQPGLGSVEGLAGWLQMAGSLDGGVDIAADLELAAASVGGQAVDQVQVLIDGGREAGLVLARFRHSPTATSISTDIQWSGQETRIQAETIGPISALADWGVGLPPAAAGEIRFGARTVLAGPPSDLLPRLAAGEAPTLTAGADGHLLLRDLSLPDTVRGLDAWLPWRLLPGPDPVILEVAPGAVAAGTIVGIPGPVRAAVPEGGTPLQLLLPMSREALTVTLDGPLSLVTPVAAIGADVRVALDTNGEFTVQEATITGALDVLDETVVEIDRLGLVGRGNVESFELSWEGRLRLPEFAAGPLLARQVDIESSGTAQRRAKGSELHLESTNLAAGEISTPWTEPFAMSGLRLAQLSVRLPDSGAPSIAGRNVPFAARLPLLGRGEPVRLVVPAIAFRVDGSGDAPGLALDWQGAELSDPETGITLTGIDGRVDGAAATLDIASISPPRGADILPQSLSATVTGELEAGVIALRGEVRSRFLSADLGGVHDVAGGVGHVDIGLRPLRFQRDGLQPATVLGPAAADWPMDLVLGRVEGSARVSWEDDLSGTGILTLRDLDIATPVALLAGVNGTIRIADLFGPTTARNQRVTAEAIDAGLPLGGGEALIRLRDGQYIDVADARLDWAGGELAAEPFVWNLADPVTDITLTAAGIELEQILSEIAVADLSGSGTLSGRLPLRLADDTILVEDGVLTSDGPGTISYRGDGLAGLGDGSAGVDLLISAIENFHYENVALTLAGETGSDLEVGISIRGANPELHDGYPIALNVSVSGRLDEILRKSLATAQLAEQAREALIRRGAGQ